MSESPWNATAPEQAARAALHHGDEWKLVPVKPTLEMAEKGAEAFSLPHPQSVGAENERAALIYRLMLSASPVPAQPIEAAEKWRLFPKKTPEEVDRDPVYREASRQLKPLRDAFMLDASPEGRQVPDDWFNQVISFFVKHEMLDAREEYDISDVMGALHDNYAPGRDALIERLREENADLRSELYRRGQEADDTWLTERERAW